MSIYTPAEQAERVTRGWIPVGERLPDYGEFILARMTYGKPSHLVVELIATTKKGAAWREFRQEGENELHHVGCVTHWQPLPLPPKEG